MAVFEKPSQNMDRDMPSHPRDMALTFSCAFFHAVAYVHCKVLMILHQRCALAHLHARASTPRGCTCILKVLHQVRVNTKGVCDSV